MNCSKEWKMASPAFGFLSRSNHYQQLLVGISEAPGTLKDHTVPA